MKVSRFLLSLVVVGCGGGASTATEPTVAIVSSSCSVLVSGLVSADVAYEVSLDPGQSFEGAIELLGPVSQPPNPHNSFSCNGWTPITNSHDRGCKRDRTDQPASVIVELDYISTPSTMGQPNRISILGRALASGSMIASDSTQLDCLVN